MELNEVMNNEEVLDVMEAFVPETDFKGLKITAGVGLGILLGGLTYKYAVKPIIAKVKAKKEEVVEEDFADYTVQGFTVDNVDQTNE